MLGRGQSPLLVRVRQDARQESISLVWLGLDKMLGRGHRLAGVNLSCFVMVRQDARHESISLVFLWLDKMLGRSQSLLFCYG